LFASIFSDRLIADLRPTYSKTKARYLDILTSKFDWDYRNQSGKWNSLASETKEFLDAFFKTPPNLRKELILNNLKPCDQKIF